MYYTLYIYTQSYCYNPLQTIHRPIPPQMNTGSFLLGLQTTVRSTASRPAAQLHVMYWVACLPALHISQYTRQHRGYFNRQRTRCQTQQPDVHVDRCARQCDRLLTHACHTGTTLHVAAKQPAAVLTNATSTWAMLLLHGAVWDKLRNRSSDYSQISTNECKRSVSQSPATRHAMQTECK